VPWEAGLENRLNGSTEEWLGLYVDGLVKGLEEEVGVRRLVTLFPRDAFMETGGRLKEVEEIGSRGLGTEAEACLEGDKSASVRLLDRLETVWMLAGFGGRGGGTSF
jgi:hypothetical protein